MSIHTIVFDGGDTLIKINPAYQGPMALWPELEVVDGVGEMLAGLAGKYRLVVGSNASDSDTGLIKKAMVRLGLDSSFSAYYTPAELDGARKPQEAFFHALEGYLGLPGSELVMVGDSYKVDISGAVASGWRAVWYNPAGIPAPGLSPLHAAEISRLIELPKILDSLALPGFSASNDWLVEQGAGPNLLIHVNLVASLAYLMAVWLRQAGEEVNPVLAHRGGLLHDLAKGPAREQKADHGLLAAHMLRDRGQTDLADIAERHVLFNLVDEARRPRTWEQKLVYFADKLVEAGRIVSFQERLAALQERYKKPTPVDEMNLLVIALTALENEICWPLRWTPRKLLEQLRLNCPGLD